MRDADAIFFVATRYSGEDVKNYRKNCFISIIFPELQLNKPNQNKPNQT